MSPAKKTPAPAETEGVEPRDGHGSMPPEVAALTYEQARDELVTTVQQLESGQGGLEDSIALWERGEMLARRCQQWLDGARTRLDDAVAARSQSEDGRA